MPTNIRKVLKSLKGFTLIELLIVIAIIAILTVAFLPTLRGGQAGARNSARKAAVNDIVIGIERIVNGDFAPAIPGAIPDGNAGVCIDFAAAGIGGNVRTALSKSPAPQPGGGVQLCNGGYFYRSYVAGGGVAPAPAVQRNYIVVVEVEGVENGNVSGAAIAHDTPANALAGVQAAFPTFGDALTKTAITPATPSANPFWVVTK